MPQTTKDVIIVLLRDLVRQIQSLDEEDLNDLIAGKGNLQVRIETAKKPMQSAKQRPDDLELKEIAQTLKGFRSRDDGQKLLEERISSKNELVRLARILDLPAQRDDTAEQLRSRLIESTIGFRLRSAAIQGTATIHPGGQDDANVPLQGLNEPPKNSI